MTYGSKTIGISQNIPVRKWHYC